MSALKSRGLWTFLFYFLRGGMCGLLRLEGIVQGRCFSVHGHRIIDKCWFPNTNLCLLRVQGSHNMIPQTCWLKTETGFIVVLEAEDKVSAGGFLLEALRGNPFEASLLAAGRWWQSLGIPWSMDTSLQSLPPSPHPLILCVSPALPFEGQQPLDLPPALIQGDLETSLVTFAEDFSRWKSYS